MPNFNYILPRVVRHFLPVSVVRYLLNHSLIIKPGLETFSPEKAVARYLDAIKLHKLSLYGKRIMVFGYGGNLTIGCLILEAGARQVVLCERQGFSNEYPIEELFMRFPMYFIKEAGKTSLNPQYIVRYHGDIEQLAGTKFFEKFDLIVSTSVFEHLKEPEIVVKSLAQLTSRNGSNIHFIDLRDHFFKYPFEMLCYSNTKWERFLNPTSNLNRLRIFNYRNLFDNAFSKLKIVTEERDLDKFSLSRLRIQKQFISGDEEEDSTTQIQVLASIPK
jgi:hypothetical protein